VAVSLLLWARIELSSCCRVEGSRLVDVNVVSLPTSFPWAALITAVSTLLGVVFTLLVTNNRETKRLQHEREIKLTEERQKAYAAMARITKNMDVPDPLEINDLAEVHAEIEMLSDDAQVLDTAEKLLGAAHRGRQAKANKDECDLPHVREEFEEAKEELDQRRTEFINLARNELGRGPRPSSELPESPNESNVQ
jgi:hypothetical protein